MNEFFQIVGVEHEGREDLAILMHKEVDITLVDLNMERMDLYLSNVNPFYNRYLVKTYFDKKK